MRETTRSSNLEHRSSNVQSGSVPCFDVGCRMFDVRRSLLAAITCSLLLTACDRHVTDSNLDQVKPDMSSKEVESILGQPTHIKTHELTLQTQMKTLPAQRYYYEQEGRTVELIFVNDKLIGKEGSFEHDVTPAKNPAAK